MGGGQGAGKETMVGDREAPREGEECHRRPVASVQKRANGKESGQQELGKEREGRREVGTTRTRCIQMCSNDAH